MTQTKERTFRSWLDQLNRKKGPKRKIKNIVFLENVSGERERALEVLEELRGKDGKIWEYRLPVPQLELHFYSERIEKEKADRLAEELATDFSWEFFNRKQLLGCVDRFQGGLTCSIS
ncbi:MAG: hypothetical protein ABEK59_02135 [Halobacteria archaeon]